MIASKFSKFDARVSGKEVFGALLPNDFDFMGNAKDGSTVKIKKGKLVEGFIDNSTIGEENGSLIRALYAVYKEDVGISILSKISKLGIEVLLRHGFTTSISDTDLPKRISNKLEGLKDDAEDEVISLVRQYESGRFLAEPGLTVEETLEAEILGVLNRIRDEIGNQIAHIKSENNYTLIMANSGAQGNIVNLAQMASCVGQQALRGRRINKGYKDRTLSIFGWHDLSPGARGFIRNGYKLGLNPFEYYYGAMTGRDSLMDTALRTPKSGYLYRRLANALQDLRVEYDDTVRDANKTVIQFAYGEDSIDVSRSEGGTINVKKIIKEVTEK